MCWETSDMVSKNADALILRPRRLFSCVVPIITEVAEVNPTVTGIEMKSIRTPKKKWTKVNKDFFELSNVYICPIDLNKIR